MSILFDGLNEDYEYEYNARLDYMHELAVEHYDPAWDETDDYEDYEPNFDLEDIPF